MCQGCVWYVVIILMRHNIWAMRQDEEPSSDVVGGCGWLGTEDAAGRVACGRMRILEGVREERGGTRCKKGERGKEGGAIIGDRESGTLLTSVLLQGIVVLCL